MMKDLYNLWLNLNVSLLCTYLRKIVWDSFFCSQWWRPVGGGEEDEAAGQVVEGVTTEAGWGGGLAHGVRRGLLCNALGQGFSNLFSGVPPNNFGTFRVSPAMN